MKLTLFLKPTTLKILLATFVFVLFVPFIHYDTGIRCFQAPCPSGAYGSVVMWLVKSAHLYIYRISLIIMGVGMVLSYIFSCGTVYTAEKIIRK